jgi:hypothetical protein
MDVVGKSRRAQKRDSPTQPQTRLVLAFIRCASGKRRRLLLSTKYAIHTLRTSAQLLSLQAHRR